MSERGYYLDNKSYDSDEDLLQLPLAGDADAVDRTVNNNTIMAMINGNNNNYCIDGSGGGGSGGGMEDCSMEIPLLVDNDDHEMSYTGSCKYGQPGFAVSLNNKTARDARTKIFLAVSLCCLFMIIEFLGGYMAGSLAIMTDAAHLASDCVSFVIGLLAIWISSRPPDQNMSFGYKRIEVIGAVISILGIWILTATLAFVAFQRLFSDDFNLDADTMMIIAGIGILINIAMAFILHGSSLFSGSHGHSHGGNGGHHHSHSHGHSVVSVAVAGAATTDADAAHGRHSHLPDGGNTLPTDVSVSTSADIVKQQHARKNIRQATCGQEQNLNLRAAVIHVFGDLVQSVGVFVASIIIKVYPNAKVADPLCTLLFSVIVILTTVNLFKESVGILLDSVPKLVPLLRLQSDLSSISGVKSVHHLNVWNHTVNHSVMMAHLIVDIQSDGDAILLEATSMVHDKYHIQHSTIQIERVCE